MRCWRLPGAGAGGARAALGGRIVLWMVTFPFVIGPAAHHKEVAAKGSCQRPSASEALGTPSSATRGVVQQMKGGRPRRGRVTRTFDLDFEGASEQQVASETASRNRCHSGQVYGGVR